MLLHGFVGDINIDWVRSGILDRLLDEGYRVIAFDARGHGLSDKPHELAAYENDALTKDAAGAARPDRYRSVHARGLLDGRAHRVARRAPSTRASARSSRSGSVSTSLQHNARGMNMVPDALLTDDPDSIEHDSIRHFREMADAIHADREALAALMAAERTEVPDLVDDVKVPVLIVTGSDDVTAGAPGPLADRFANGKGVQTAGDHAGREGPARDARGDGGVPRVDLIDARKLQLRSLRRPSSPVRIRSASATSMIHTFPSPMVPVRAASAMPCATLSASPSSTSTLEPQLGQVVHLVLRAAVHLGVTTLPAVPAHLGERDTGDGELVQCLRDLVDLERLDDRNDQLHRNLLLSISSPSDPTIGTRLGVRTPPFASSSCVMPLSVSAWITNSG